MGSEMALDRRFLVLRVAKPILFVLLLLPFSLLVWKAVFDGFGANPVEEITHQTGLWALRILLLTLAVTPLRRITGIGELLRLRRMFGLYSFFYAALHFTTYLWLDQGFSIAFMVEDVIERPYITFGFCALMLMLPLAVTSTDRAMRALGRRWKRLHRLVYPCAVLVVLHYLWLVKADHSDPLLYLGLLLLLFALRMPSGWLRQVAFWRMQRAGVETSSAESR